MPAGRRVDQLSGMLRSVPSKLLNQAQRELPEVQERTNVGHQNAKFVRPVTNEDLRSAVRFDLVVSDHSMH